MNASKKVSAKKAAPVTETKAAETKAAPAESPKAPEQVKPETKAAEPVKKPLPFGGKKAEPFKTLGARDVYGFGNETETSYLLSALESGKYTKAELLAAFLAKFNPSGEKSEEKRKKTSFSVFFSDVRRPFGKYHASRNLGLLIDESGKLSLEPESATRAKKAIAGGILDKIRGLSFGKTPEKLRLALKGFGLPTDLDEAAEREAAE